MPLDTRRLIQLAARPMFQGGAGAIERDLADVHANLSDIKEGREPADFRSGTLAMRSQLPLLASRQKISFES